MKNPFVTVLMPVYNGEKYLAEAIDSILQQTFTDFEFLIVDDGSKDGTEKILADYADREPRIRIARNEKNLGIIESLNKGIRLSQGECIARMDADDVSLPRRIEKQVSFMREHPAVAVCGTFISCYETGTSMSAPIDNEEIRAHLLFSTYLYHPTIMMRKEPVTAYGNGYDPQASHAEDYDLWARLSLHDDVAFANIPQVLLRYRIHPERARTSYKESQRNTADAIRKLLLGRLGVVPTEEEYGYHKLFLTKDSVKDNEMLTRAGRWLDKIYDQNGKLAIYDDEALKNTLSAFWWNLCRRSVQNASLAPFLFFSPACVRKNLKNLLKSGCLLLFRCAATTRRNATTSNSCV